MDNKLNYQQARRIRGQSLSDLFAEQLIGGSDFIPGFKKSIGLKTQARIKGIKEKFDPLNIAKALTGGSRIGPAILGKLLGRDRKDIEYFAGRARPVGDKAKNMTGVSKKEKSDKVAGIKAGLSKILNFLEKSRDTDIKMIEKENNFKEEKEREDKRRHNDLMTALKSLIGKTGPNKIESGGKGLMDFFGDLKDKLKQRAADAAERKTVQAAEKKVAESAVQKAVGGVVTETAKDTVEQKTATKVGETLVKKAGAEVGEQAVESAVKKTVATKIGSYFMKNVPLGIGLLFSIGAGATRAVQGDWTGASAEIAAGAASALPVIGTSAGIAINVGLMARDVYKDVYKTFPEDDYKKDPEGTKRKVEFIMSIVQSALPQIESATSPEEMEIDVNGNLQASPSLQKIKKLNNENQTNSAADTTSNSPAASEPVKVSPTPVPSAPEPVKEIPKSDKLSSAIQTNNDLNLDSKVAQATPVSTTTNVQAPVKSGEGFKPQLGFASVRNQDDTLQRLLFDSTRAV